MLGYLTMSGPRRWVYSTFSRKNLLARPKCKVITICLQSFASPLVELVSSL